MARIRDCIRRRDLDPASAIRVIRLAATLSPSWRVALDAVREIAKGADGVAGTADDLIPTATLDLISRMLDGGAVGDLLDWVSSLEDDLSEAVAAAQSCGKCCSPPWWRAVFSWFSWKRRGDDDL